MSLTIPIGWRDPITAFAPFSGEPWAMLLDSAAVDSARGRYVFLAARPRHTLLDPLDPFAALTEALGPRRPVRHDTGLPFAGGAVGLFGYELGRHLERAPRRHAGEPGEMAVGIYDAVAGFDLWERRAWVIAATPEARGKAERLAAEIAAAPDLAPPMAAPAMTIHPELSRADYLARVAQVIAYIAAGDIFQANFTQRFLAPRPAGYSAFDLYRRLRALNPAPFAAFLTCGSELTVVTASPERFLSLDRTGLIEARPIKGTRKRSPDPAEDAAIAAELAASIKDRAENLMITDLLRNDIGRVAATGSVAVSALNAVESFATLHHLVSVIEGRLRSGLGPVDLLRATFPGGSITGAPKVRAMEIIDELEPGPRGPYCGAIGWIGFDGAMDSSIVIRSISLTPDRIAVQAGGAIVADSQPDAEYAEMMAKAAPALAALGGRMA
jgi:para-aminobenzoate synthetase component 1